MKYTLQEGQSFDAEILRQELVAAIGSDGWYISTAGNTVEFVTQDDTLDPTETIEVHFTNGASRDHNKVIIKQIEALEATQTPRRIREGGQWVLDLETQIATLRGQLL